MSRIKIQFSVFLLICFFALSNSVFAVTKTTTASGSWSNPAIWSPAGVPASSDDVVISSAHSITISQPSFCKSLIISGNAVLSLSPSKLLARQVQVYILRFFLYIRDQGYRMGSPSQ